MVDSIQEMGDAIATCSRETILYEDPELYEFVGQIYDELLDAIHWTCTWLSSSGVKSRFKSLELQFKYNRFMARIHKISQRILREADYRHRLEMRETSSRIVDMQVEQQKILAKVEDQKRILQSMQEERQIMDVVQKQQRILQVVQQIHGSMQRQGAQE